MRAGVWIAIGVFALGSWIALGRRHEAATSDVPVLESAAEPVAPVAPKPASRVVAEPAAAKASAGQAQAAEMRQVPRVEDAREQVAKDPHAPPLVLVQFAASLAPRLDAALASSEKATVFFGEMRECALGSNDTLSSARALCLANAHRVAKKFPGSLKASYEDLWSASPPELQRLASYAKP